MSVIAARFPRSPFGRGTDAGGDDARSITEFFASLLESETPQNLSTSFSEGVAELEAAFQESSVYDWDGEGAIAANPLSKLWARRLLKVLPSDIRTPMIVFGRNGDAVLEWAPRPGRRLTIRVSCTGELRYARTLNARQTADVDTFSGTEMPEGLAGLLLGFF